MNRRQKIIVSVTGIFIVLLALVGLTYGYFLTRIQGNTSDKSISVTTANLALVYRDGSPELITSETPIVPGKFKESKTFTVTNEGNAIVDSYGVYLEDFSVTYANDGVDNNGQPVTKDQTTSFNSPTDMKMVITCKSVNAKTGVESGTCDGVDGTLPTGNTTLLTNSIEVGIRHEYTLTLEYVETGVDQSADMNKTINGKIQIYNEQDVVNIEGSVTGANAGDYVQINSVQKISQIVNGNYVLTGVEPGEHTLKVFNSAGELRGSTTLTINKGTANNVSGTTITVTDKAEKAITNITEIKGDKTLTINVDSTIKEASPFRKGTLAYNILNNAIKNADGEEKLYGTRLVTTPTTIPGQAVTTVYGIDVNENVEVNISKWHYGSSSSEDETNPVYGTYADVCTEDMIGKYMYVWVDDYTDTNGYYIISQDGVYGPIVGCSNGKPLLHYSSNVPKYEQELSTTEDDFGISYYYRGDVVDNYMNYSGMCWRIVRIQGDGKIKLVLDNENGECGLSSSSTSALIGGGNIQGGGLDYATGTIPGILSSWIKDKSFDVSKLSETEWCNEVDYREEEDDRTADGGPFYIHKFYDGVDRLVNGNPSLKCQNHSNRFKSNIGILTADEIAFAGSVFGYGGDTPIFYLNSNISEYITMTPYAYFMDNDEAFGVSEGLLIENQWSGGSIRPAIVLQENLAVTGNGTIGSPYEVK